MKITNAELVYIYKLKDSKHSINTVGGWTKEICNPQLSRVARIAVLKLINDENKILEEHGMRMYKNRKFKLYKLNDHKLIKLFEKKYKEWFGKGSYFDIKKRIVKDLIIDRRILSADVKEDELNQLRKIKYVNFEQLE